MLGYQRSVDTTRKPSLAALNKGRLIGYILTAKHSEAGKEFVLRLEDKVGHLGYKLDSTEWDVGIANNPFRVGLWRTFRRLICSECEPRRMPFSVMSFDDFLHQALAPCQCRQDGTGLDGLVVWKIDHLTSDRKQGAEIILRLARLNKHVIAEDGICLSCCHPATRNMLNGAK